MAEKMMLVCDVCGSPAADSVTFKTSAGNRQKDYCARHLRELLEGSRIPKRGRKPGSRNKPRPAAKTASSRKRTAAKRSAVKK